MRGMATLQLLTDLFVDFTLLPLGGETSGRVSSVAMTTTVKSNFSHAHSHTRVDVKYTEWNLGVEIGNVWKLSIAEAQQHTADRLRENTTISPNKRSVSSESGF
ncbi:hypothetical protein OUZ56_027442 [Daphnia magna]|uniref:Uncharacterized protein n=1 Tax=Daphnia magna TaxID=35525 RepID=A0ABQ9ZPS2_9CRUS|nr:hypothetical protein OUZ56_027442 [Daphnia magna]